MRRIRDEDQLQNLRGYSADPWSRQRLETSKVGGVPVARANVPQMLTIESDADGKWWGNKPMYGPFDSIRELEIAVYGQSDLSDAKRDWRDSAPPSE
jgi:hypothetical protein